MNNGVSFESVARVVCSRKGWPWDELTTAQFELLRTEINDALRWAWDGFWWEDLMVVKRMTLRKEWAPGTGALLVSGAGSTECNGVYQYVSETEYQHLYSGVKLVLEAGIWKLKTHYIQYYSLDSGSVIDAPAGGFFIEAGDLGIADAPAASWAQLMPAGTEVYHAQSDAYYVAFVEAAGQAPATYASATDTWVVNASFWARIDDLEDCDGWAIGTAYAAGDRVEWNGDFYACVLEHTASASVMPNDTTYWYPLPVLDWTVAKADEDGARPVIGKVRTVTALDPRTYPGDTEYEFSPNAEGVQVLNMDGTQVWMMYRVQCPDLTGSAWSSASAYAAEAAEKAVWGL